MAAAAARTRTRRAAPPPRRISGPVRGGRAATVTAPPPLALRVGGAIHGIAEHRWLERIIRGRAWIGILAVGLIGIVFMQVSMLRLNNGIGRDIEQSSQLERQNAAMRATLSELTSGDRIEAEAAKLGFVLPPAGAARFLSARGFDPARALRNIQVPSHLAPLPIGTDTTVSSTSPTAATLPATGVAPSATATTATTTPTTGTTATGTTTPTTATTTATPTQTTAPPATTATPPTTAQPASATPPPSGGTTSTATTTPATTGGVAPTGAR